METEIPMDPERINSGRVLVIDDDEDFVDMTSEALEMLGFDVIITKTGRTALDVYRTRTKEIDVIMLDLTLPEMGGPEIFSELRNINPSAKIVLCSGSSQEGEATCLLEKGACAYVQKPFRIADLSNTFKRIINRSGKTN